MTSALRLEAGTPAGSHDLEGCARALSFYHRFSHSFGTWPISLLQTFTSLITMSWSLELAMTPKGSLHLEC